MPLINTSGVNTDRGYGLFALPRCTDGTKGIFALGQYCYTNYNSRDKYTYASCTSTASGGVASVASSYGSAAGNSTRGIFALGCGGGSIRNKYTYSSCTSTASGVGSASTCSSRGSAAGNSTRGIFAFGAGSATRNKYTYSSCTSTACGVGSASATSNYSSAAGNSTRGIFALGITGVYPCAHYSSIRNKYTYSSCTSTACGVASASFVSYLGSAAGNSTRGIFALGCGTTTYATRDKYTYASCTSTACGVGSASAASLAGSAAGNSTRGIFALGIAVGSCYSQSASTTRNKYTYSSCTSTASGVGGASFSSSQGSAASWATCVNI